MERIKVFKLKKGFIKFFLIFGIIFFIFGMSLLIYSLINGFKTEFFGGDWNSIIYSFQGILFIFMGYQSLKNDKYFIEWNDEELRYFLPQNKLTETIRLSDIKKVEIELFEINIQLPESDKKISLENIEFKELRKIKEKLGEIKKSMENN